MPFAPKSLSLVGAIAALPLVAGLAAGAGLAAAGEYRLPWREGVIEANRYTIEEGGTRVGEIEQRLYGETRDGRQVHRLVYDVARSAVEVDGQTLIGRVNIDIVFVGQTFDSLERTDRYAVADAEGRVTYTRTPRGYHLRSEGAAQGIPRPSEERDVHYDADGPLVDNMVLVYYIRSLPLEEGHRFEVLAINPTQNTVNRLRGMVAGRQMLRWQGEDVEVQRIETSTPDGVTSYFVRTDGSRALLRYASARGETYELQRPGGE